jgi:ssDNA-binding Zn-finger/Zn-ribbon topoisomerase 1
MQAGDQHIRPRPEFIPPGRKYGMCGNLPNCRKADQCTFAHSEAEMRAWNEELAMTRSTEHVPTRVRCRPMPKGVKPSKGEFMMCDNFPDCKEGEACTFSHSEEERYEWNWQLRKELNIRKRPTRTPHGEKFKLCANLPNCPKGDLCTFAHSEAEEHAWNKELAGDSTDSGLSACIQAAVHEIYIYTLLIYSATEQESKVFQFSLYYA